MGFRSYLFTEEPGYDVQVPAWFLEKWKSLIAVNNKGGKGFFPVASKFETKFYQEFDRDERFLDLQKILQGENDPDIELRVILLHECGGITKVLITPTSILSNEPVEWSNTASVTHSYCYGCSDPDLVMETTA
jgi:hypothetical protein